MHETTFQYAMAAATVRFQKPKNPNSGLACGATNLYSMARPGGLFQEKDGATTSLRRLATGHPDL
jgi:hypothetical protein